jgi:hypothetical protein
MLLLPEGQTDEGWEPSKSNAVSEIEGTLDRKLFSLL